jgi:hypothetical protein
MGANTMGSDLGVVAKAIAAFAERIAQVRDSNETSQSKHLVESSARRPDVDFGGHRNDDGRGRKWCEPRTGQIQYLAIANKIFKKPKIYNELKLKILFYY